MSKETLGMILSVVLSACGATAWVGSQMSGMESRLVNQIDQNHAASVERIAKLEQWKDNQDESDKDRDRYIDKMWSKLFP